MRGYNSSITGYLFALPWLLGFVLLTVYPFLASLYWSFCRYDLIGSPEFVGVQHYRRIIDEFAAGEGVSQALWNTAYFALASIPLSIVIGIALAVALSWSIRGQSLFRTICFLPCIVPTVASAILWMWLLDPRRGMVNYVLSLFGLPTPGWFSDHREALWLPDWFSGSGGFGSKDGLVLMSIWGLGNVMVIYLAAIQGVPSSLYEAAAMDGAGRWRRFWHVTLPMITPVIFFNLEMGLIQSFQAFAQMYVVSEGTGAPERSLLVLSLHLFLSAFQDLNMGYASAIAWITFVFLFLATALLFATSSRWVHYDGGIR